RVTMICADSTNLKAQLAAGSVDLILTTEHDCGPDAEILHSNRLVWVGLPGGDAHLRNPLPISVGGTTCMFRPAALEVLRNVGRDWRIVCEVSNMEPVVATIVAGLAVAPLLSECVPPNLARLGPESGLPELPMFNINLYVSHAPATEVARELAKHIRHEFK